MSTEGDINDAIAQLTMLGIDEKKAIKALSRYNYNVERAADYVFSGNLESDDDDSTNDTDIPGNNNNNNSTDWPWTEPSSFDNISTTVNQPPPPPHIALDSISDSGNETEKTPVYLVKDYEKNAKKTDPTHDPSSWSVVPFTAQDTQPSKPPSVTLSSLTWWSDPTSPSARVAISDIPAGLRPPSYNFAYSPILIQALFHLPLFRHSVLAYRPTPTTWGAPQNYWKGFGEPVPGYTRSITTTTTTTTVSIETPINLMDASLDDLQTELEPSPTSTTENELLPLTKEQQALAELQKLFAFLGNTTRLYGSVAHYMRAVNTRPVTASSGWQVDDKSIDDFLDSVIGGLVAAESGATSANEHIGLEKLFFLQAEVDNGIEVDIEDIYYLNLGINKPTSSFHDCLDPLVYESYPANSEDDEDLGSQLSDEEYATYKLTTFMQVPPILLVTLEDRREYIPSRTKTDGVFNVDKVIYMDRYLFENKALILDKYRLADQWKQDIRCTQDEIDSLERDKSSSNDDPSLCKHELLEATTKYLDSQVNALEWTDENEAYIKSIRSLQQVLYQVREDIENKKTELQNLIHERQHSLKNLFNESDLHQRPYDLRAVLHTDGLSGTGHYWGYIWVELVEVNLLADIPSHDGGWYRFCDAKVEKVTEQDVWAEPTDPFALVYTDRSAPSFTKQQIDHVTPTDLMQFVQLDNAVFQNEINNEFTSQQSSIQQRPDSQLSTETDRGSIFFDDNGITHPFDDDNSNTDGKDNNNDSNSLYPSNDTAPSSEVLPPLDREDSLDPKTMESAAIKMNDIRNCSGDDYRLMKRFDTFLARAGDIHTLASYYQHVESGTLCLAGNGGGDDDDKEDLVDPPSYEEETNMGKMDDILDTLTFADIRTIVRNDKTLFLLFELYEQYLSMGQTLATALSFFIDNNLIHCLEHIVKSGQQHDSWRTHLMLNDAILWKYNGLVDLGFDPIAVKFGMACIKKLNMEAYTKACDTMTRNRGLKDGIRIANQAQWVIRRDAHRDMFLTQLAERWLNFTEVQSGSLTEDQVELLNTLVMVYLDGPTTTASTSATTTATAPDDASLFSLDSVSLPLHGKADEEDEPVWVTFRQALWDAESKLADF